MPSDLLDSESPQSPPPKARTSRKATSPQGLFKQPEDPDPSPGPLPPPSPSHPSGIDFGPSEEPAPATPRNTSSTLSVSDKRLLVEALEGAAGIAGEALHGLVANEVDQEFDLFLLDDKDKTGIAKPTANLLVRRGVMAASPDIADLCMLLVALAEYVRKQLGRRREARRWLQAQGQPDQATETAA